MQHENAEAGFENGDTVVDARAIAVGLGLEAAQVPELMRQAKITSLHEKGLDDHAGRHRVTFFHSDRNFQLVLDESGNVMERSTATGDVPE